MRWQPQQLIHDMYHVELPLPQAALPKLIFSTFYANMALYQLLDKRGIKAKGS